MKHDANKHVNSLDIFSHDTYNNDKGDDDYAEY